VKNAKFYLLAIFTTAVWEERNSKGIERWKGRNESAAPVYSLLSLALLSVSPCNEKEKGEKSPERGEKGKKKRGGQG